MRADMEQLYRGVEKTMTFVSRIFSRIQGMSSLKMHLPGVTSQQVKQPVQGFIS